MHGGHLGHLTLTVLINLVTLSHEGSICELSSVSAVAAGQKLFDI